MSETRLETFVYSVAFCAVILALVVVIQFVFTGAVDVDLSFYAIALVYFYVGRRSAVDGGAS